YVVAGTVEGLPPGVHHFCPGDSTLRRLRGEDARAALAEAAADATPGRRGATLVLTGLVWRNSWKYRARTYRHLFWDGGTMLANALATAAALGLAPRLFTGFVDAAVHRLLGIDGAREVDPAQDRKSTRLTPSHDQTAYAVFCSKKKRRPEDH